MIEAPDIDLSTIPVAQRAVVVALMETIAALQEITRRQQHLIAEMNHALHGKRSEKLADAYKDALARGPRWRDRIDSSLMRLPETASILHDLG